MDRPIARTARLARTTAIAALSLLGVLAASVTQPTESAAEDDEYWERVGPSYYANGAHRKPERLEVTDSSVLSKSDGGKSNSMTWKIPPEVLRRGDTLDLTLSSSTGEGAPMIGEIRVSGCGERTASVADTTVVSFKGGSRRDDFSHGRFVCVFRPGSAPTIGYKAGRYDDYSGEMTLIITWKYERKTGKPPGERGAKKTMTGTANVGGIYFDGRTDLTMPYGDTPLETSVNVADSKTNQGFPDVEVEWRCDGAVVGRGKTGAYGLAHVAWTMPTETPTGRSDHTLGFVARHPDYTTLERSWPIVFTRELLPLTIEAVAKGGPFAIGESMTIEGRVFSYRTFLPNDPVRAHVAILQSFAAKTALAELTTTDDGRFTATVTVPETPGTSLDIRAIAVDRRYDDGKVSVEFQKATSTSIRIEAKTDRAVYPLDGTVRVSGTVSDLNGPLEADLELSVYLHLVPPHGLSRLKSGKDGTFQVEVPVRSLSPPNALQVDTLQVGYATLYVIANAVGHTQNEDALQIALKDDMPAASLAEFEVTDVRGAPAVNYPAVLASTALRKSTARVGARYTQGAVVQLTGGEAATLWMPCGPGGGGVQLAVKGPTTFRVGTFYVDADGRVRLRVFASEPSTISVTTVHGEGARPPLDYQIITASSTVTSKGTEYDVITLDSGDTTIVAKQDVVQLIPKDPAEPARLVRAGETATAHRPKVTGPRPAANPAAPGRGAADTPGPTTPEAPPRPDPSPGAPPAAGLDLGDGKLAANGWDSTGEHGAKATVADDGLVLDVPASSDGEVTSFSKTPLVGDFDLTIEYTLTDWKPSEEAGLYLRAMWADKPSAESKRAFVVRREAADTMDRIVIESAEGDTSEKSSVPGRAGALRVVRSGRDFTVFQRDGAKWRRVASLATILPPTLYLGFALERQGPVLAKASVRPRWTSR